jgi:hypothetical protein
MGGGQGWGRLAGERQGGSTSALCPELTADTHLRRPRVFDASANEAPEAVLSVAPPPCQRRSSCSTVGKPTSPTTRVAFGAVRVLVVVLQTRRHCRCGAARHRQTDGLRDEKDAVRVLLCCCAGELLCEVRSR